MKSPARVPTSHVPVLLIAPSGASVFTPFGETDWANAALAPTTNRMAVSTKGLRIVVLSFDLAADLLSPHCMGTYGLESVGFMGDCKIYTAGAAALGATTASFSSFGSSFKQC